MVRQPRSPDASESNSLTPGAGRSGREAVRRKRPWIPGTGSPGSVLSRPVCDAGCDRSAASPPATWTTISPGTRRWTASAARLPASERPPARARVQGVEWLLACGRLPSGARQLPVGTQLPPSLVRRPGRWLCSIEVVDAARSAGEYPLSGIPVAWLRGCRIYRGAGCAARGLVMAALESPSALDSATRGVPAGGR